MKKQSLTVIILFLSFSAFSQSFKIDVDGEKPEKSSIEVTKAAKALLIIEYKDERLNMGSMSTNTLIADIELHLVERFQVYKGKSAITAFGDGAKNGVILLHLKKGKAAKSMFEDFKKLLNDGLLIDTDKEMGVDKRTGFPIGKPDEFSISNSNELAKLSKLRPGSMEPSTIFIMSLNGKEKLIKDTQDIKKIAAKHLKSIDILKDEESKSRYNSKGKDVIIVTFKSAKETKKFFRKLKKVKNK